MGHAYTVLGTKVLTDANGNKIKLVKIRNPWGTEDYKGAYSDNSDKWTPALRTQAGSVIKNDGEFFMPIDDYKKYCGETYINFNVDNMSRSTFLVLDDTNTETRQGGKCGGTCSYHKFTLKSPSDQKVYLKIATWDDRAMPKKCKKQVTASKRKNHNFTLYGGTYGDSEADAWNNEFAGGEDAQFPDFTMKAGVEYTLNVEMQWQAPEVAKDFSVVAQGAANGVVEITHWKGLTSK